MNHIPEQLSLWDRWFNRYRREVVERKTVTYGAFGTEVFDRQREVVIYRIVDRLTGSETIEREYLN